MHICNTDIVTRDISQTSLDHIYTNNFETTTHQHYAPYDLLDHKLIFIETTNTNVTVTNNRNNTTTAVNYQKLKQRINETTITTNATTDVNDFYNDFIQNLETINNQMHKNQKKDIKTTTKTLVLEQLIKIKNFWYTRKSRDPRNIQHSFEYKLARYRATAKLRNKKKLYFENGFTESLNDNKRTWYNI